MLKLFNIPSYLRFKQQYIFILSHKRSYSTLLAHILATNNEICGYTETKLSYKRPYDLKRLKNKARKIYKDQYKCRYFLDKIVNEYIKISDEILRNDNVKIIFLLREPVDTLRSLIEMKLQNNVIFDENKAEKYYINRLNTLTHYSNMTMSRSLLIKSEDLINNTEAILSETSKYLNLNDQLKSEYDTFEYTGITGIGDPSEYIKKGKIIKDRKIHNISISDELKSKCLKAYNECFNKISENSLRP